MQDYGAPPQNLGDFSYISLDEVMYYLYLPIKWNFGTLGIRMPNNLHCLRPLVTKALLHANSIGVDTTSHFVYISARKGWATPDNPLNRSGWHCDGFGTEDLNYLWWKGPGTRFALQHFNNISKDHIESQKQFQAQLNAEFVIDDLPQQNLYAVNPFVVHSTPILKEACVRQYVKISISKHRYNLYNNSHNCLFNYKWDMIDRETIRNDTHKAQRDYA